MSADARRRLVIYETDHQALLEACRKVIIDTREGRWIEGRMYDFLGNEAAMSQWLPPALSQLKPTRIIPYKDYLRIQMLGGIIGNAGVIAFMDDAGVEPSEYGDIQLIDGLWYYDDCYDTEDDWDKHIASLRPQQ